MHDQIDFSIDGLSSGLRRMLSRWRSRAVTSITATTCTSTFCCKRAVEDGIMPVNPVPATVYTHCRSKKLTILSDDAQATLEKWLFSDLSLNNAGIILALYTGMRLGEVCAVRWRDYDAASGTLHITQTVRRVTIDLVLIFKATPHNWTRAISAKRRNFHCAVLP